jgi:hypothetical protein
MLCTESKQDRIFWKINRRKKKRGSGRRKSAPSNLNYHITGAGGTGPILHWSARKSIRFPDESKA